MLFHNKCNNFVRVNSSGQFMFLTGFAVTNKGLRITNGDIKFKRNPGTDFLYYCEECNKDVQVEDLDFRCMCCGKLLPIDEGFKPEKSGGTYCSECGKSFSNNGEMLIKLTMLVSNIYLEN